MEELSKVTIPALLGAHHCMRVLVWGHMSLHSAVPISSLFILCHTDTHIMNSKKEIMVGCH